MVIEEVDHLRDGRSIVRVKGGRRFKVLTRSHRDGYSTASVQLLKDSKIPEESLGTSPFSFHLLITFIASLCSVETHVAWKRAHLFDWHYEILWSTLYLRIVIMRIHYWLTLISTKTGFTWRQGLLKAPHFRDSHQRLIE